MHDYRNDPLSDEDRETRDKLFSQLTSTRAADEYGAIFNMDKNARKEEREAFRRLKRLSKTTTPEIGTVKSIGGVDYEVTDQGWVKIGLTEV
ncbi:hypothetical protein [uncultured Paraglaciecola sp.]|uniref:hypothetical protein n=1 Tax=uncultured Paraglaciecola sp. TaxID=1765024 RepID=UPI002621329D|nr:hypothetical protein [uncultured Paraglaciecola sp.]